MKYYLLLFVAIVYSPIRSQTLVRVTGLCTNEVTDEAIGLVSIYDSESNTVVFSDSIGRYDLLLPRGKVRIEASFVGFKSRTKNLILKKDIVLNFQLKPSTQLGEVNVIGKKIEDVVSAPQMGEIHLSPKLMSTLPSLGGEPDLIKAIQLLPGVQNGSEGKTGLYVRGGGPGQNLVLIEGIPIYDISHIGGFFSVFNMSAIEEVSLKKGSFPARYGGRLSSVLDVKIKSGRPDKVRANIGIGLLASNFTIDGPIKKGKSSFMISARRTYPDLIVGPIKKIQEEDGLNGHLSRWNLHFSDLYLKTKFLIDRKNELRVFGFLTNDVLREAYRVGEKDFNTIEDYGIFTKNHMAVLTWLHQPKNNMSLTTSTSFTQYSVSNFDNLKVNKGTESYESKNIFTTDIHDWIAKTDLVWGLNKHTLRVGVNGILHRYLPGKINFFSNLPGEQIDTSSQEKRLIKMEYSGYFEDTWTVGHLKMNLGLHASVFGAKGQYTSVEPRIAVRYRLNSNWSIKAAYSNMVQYVNLVTNDGAGLPFNIWALTNEKIVPQKAYQLAVGVAMKKNNYEFTVDAYYKKMKNVLAIKGGSSFFDFSTNWEEKVVQGKGEAYGVEFFANRKLGRFTGWLGYTQAWNWRRFNAFNEGKRFPFRYDRRHDVKVVLNYEKSKKTSFSAVWVYGTGNAVTLPIGIAHKWPTTIFSNKYSHSIREDLVIYSKRNEYREPAYHRLDLAVKLTKKKKRGVRTWSFGLYNAYARANPAYLYVGKVYKNGNEFDHYGIFRKTLFTLLPSIAYSFKMN